ncbi:MAG: hypothetical protein FJW27_19435 [Acidimicrobiia bacterium]|nr:hypothetical protein [Acidimicrobiia bacterium]
MARITLPLMLLLFAAARSDAQTVADKMIAAFEAGARLRMQQQWLEQAAADKEAVREFYRQQLRVLEAQNRVLQLQADELERARQRRETAILAQASAEAKADLEAFSLRRPGWQAYEKAMVTFSRRIEPGQLDTQAYLDVLYFLARRDEYDALLREAAREQADAALAEFTRLHPDWRQYESRMMELSKAVLPAPNMTDTEYLTVLYNSARRERR